MPKKSITDAPCSKTCDELPLSQMRYINLALIPAVNTLSVQTRRFIDAACKSDCGGSVSVGADVGVSQSGGQRAKIYAVLN